MHHFFCRIEESGHVPVNHEPTGPDIVIPDPIQANLEHHTQPANVDHTQTVNDEHAQPHQSGNRTRLCLEYCTCLYVVDRAARAEPKAEPRGTPKNQFYTTMAEHFRQSNQPQSKRPKLSREGQIQAEALEEQIYLSGLQLAIMKNQKEINDLQLAQQKNR